MHMIKKLITLVALIALSLSATELPSEVKFETDGTFSIDDIRFTIKCHDAKWHATHNGLWRDRKFTLEPSGLKLSATMTVGEQSAEVTETITSTGANTFQVKFNAKFAEPVTVNSIYGELLLPGNVSTITVDGKPNQFPAEYSKSLVYRNPNASKMSFTTTNGAVVTVSSSPLSIDVRDKRNTDPNALGFFQNCLFATPDKGQLTEASLTLDFAIEPIKLQLVDLSHAANVDFADEVEGDGKGGWTDQGRDVDLHMIKPGILKFGLLEFNVLNAKANHGKGALVLSGECRKFTPSTATVTLPANNASAINLLHANAWGPSVGTTLGFIIAEYADGSSEQIPVVSGVDCNGWYNPRPAENVAIAWKGKADEFVAGLLASTFALRKAGPQSLRFELASNDAIWMIVGVTLSDRRISPHNAVTIDNKPVEIKEDAEWKKLDYKRTIRRGGPLDFSSYLDEPAGKYGFIRSTPAGTLTFEKAPDKRIRLWGPNLVHRAIFLTKDAVDNLVEYLAYCGYNSLRIIPPDKYLLDKKASDSVTINAEQLDKLDYLFYKLKEKGLYVCTDCYAARVFKPGDNIPECDYYDKRQMNGLIAGSQAARDNWKEFVRRWMTHKNPYTSMTWGEDPALWCLNLLNEDSVYDSWSNNTPMSVKRIYEREFKKYCESKGIAPSEPTVSNPVFMQFLYDIKSAEYVELMDFVKNELNMKAMITSLNFYRDIPLTLLRQRFDVVDSHCYYEHPNFPEKSWQLPSIITQTSAIKNMAATPRMILTNRIPGLPFISTEINLCGPNVFRAESGPLIGGYAALQNWDALYRFEWCSRAEDVYNIDAHNIYFATAHDPLGQFSDRIIAAMFLRGDVASAQETYAYSVPVNSVELGIRSTFPSAFKSLGLVTKVGSIAQDSQKVPSNLIKVNPEDATDPSKLRDVRIAELWKKTLDEQIAISSTGQIQLNGRTGTFTVSTPRSASVTLHSGSLSAGALRVKNASCFQTIAAISLDDNPIPESNSVLVFQLTNTSKTGVLFDNASKQTLRNIGKMPMLVYKGSATVEIATTRPYKIEALNCDGESYGAVEGTMTKDAFSFKADTTLFPGGVMAYHLTR